MVTTEDLLRGDSLRVVLVPDPAAPHNYPEITESLELSHVIIDGDRFWGITSRVHGSFGIPGIEGRAADEPCCYAYSNYAGIVVNASKSWDFLRIYDSNSYKKMEFIALSDCRLVWESGKTESMGELREAITKGRRLKVGLLDDDGLWNLHPVHQPTIRNESEYFELFTDDNAYPEVFRNSQVMTELGTRINGLLEGLEKKGQRDLADNRCFHIKNSRYYSCWNIVTSSGLSRRVKPIPECGDSPFYAQPYRSLRVFAEG